MRSLRPKRLRLRLPSAAPTRSVWQMPSDREKMETWTLTQVLDLKSNSQPGTLTYGRAEAEVQRRLMETDGAALEAQQKAASAASDAAQSARLSARWTVVAAIISAVSLIASAASLFRK